MSASPTQPLPSTPPAEPPQVVEFNEKVRALLAFALIFSLLVVVLVWTFRAPELPGDTAGMIITGYVAAISSIGGFYWATYTNKTKA